MKRSILLSLSFFVFLVPYARSEAEASKEVSIFSGGKFSISLPKEPPTDPMLSQALADFARCLSLMTGTTIPKEGGNGTIPIILDIATEDGKTVSAADTRAWGNFEIEVSEKQIKINAVSVLGVANALYRLLEEWGCRWVMPGEIGECIPRKSLLQLPVGRIDGTLSTDFRLSGSSSNPETALWQQRNQASLYQRWLTAQHYWNYMIPPAEYFDPKKGQTYHPEYYALIGGSRTPTQLCTSNPQVVKLAIEAAREFFRKFPSADSFPADPNDNLDFCQCEECLKLDPPGLTPEGLPLMTDRVVDFANKIARGIRGEFPGKKVGFYAYMNHALPPVRVKPEPEILVGVTRSNYDLLRLTPKVEGDSANQFYKLLSDWKKLVPSVYTYEYNPIYWNGNLLCPNFLGWGQTVKDTIALGAEGVYSDGQLGMDNKINFLNFLMQFRIAVDASREPEAELREICSIFYGPAAAQMFEYLSTLSKVEEYGGKKIMGGGLRYYHEMFTPEMIQEARRHLDKAVAEVGSQEPYATRVRMADISEQFLEMYLQGVWEAQKGDFDASSAAFDRMEAIIPKLGETGLVSASGVFDVEDTARRMRAARLMAIVDNFPDKMGAVQKWKLLGPLDNSDRGAELRKDSFEPIKSIDEDVKLENGAVLKWISYENKRGFLELKKAFQSIPSSWNALYGYAGFKINSPTKRTAIFRMSGFNSFRVFLNGKEVFYRAGWDADEPDRCEARVILEKGENTVVVKATHTSDTDSFPWGVWFRITDRNGVPFPDIELTN